MPNMKSTTNYSNQRVGIFVDVQNLYHSAKNLYHGRVNYAELMKHLVGDRQLIRAMAYVVKSEGVEPQRPTNARLRAQAAANNGNEDRREAHAENGNGGSDADMSSEAAFFEALEKAGL